MDNQFDLDVQINESSNQNNEHQRLSGWICKKLLTVGTACCPGNTQIGHTCDNCA